MKTVHKLLMVVLALGLLATVGCKKPEPLDLSMQRNRIFLMGRLLVGKTCDVRVIWRKAPDDPAPVTVTVDLSEIGGPADQALAASGNGTWRWAGQVSPDTSGERLIIITSVGAGAQTKEVSKRFRVFDTAKAIAIAAYYLSGLALKADGTVVAWSFDDGSRAETPAGLTNVTAIAEGGHSLALTDNGTVVAWGCTNPNWDLGQCDVPEGLGDVVGIAAGGEHSLALKADGTVVAWGGYASYPEYLKMYVPAGLTDVVAVAAYSERCAAVKADGTVAPWPHNYSSDAAKDLYDVVSVSLGYNFDLPVKSDGTVVEIYNEKPVGFPIRLAGLKATATASGYWGNIALQQDGSVMVWSTYGYDECELSRPRLCLWVRVFGTLDFHRLNNIIAVGAFSFGLDFGEYYAALTEDGSVIAWDEQWTKNKLAELPVPAELQ